MGFLGESGLGLGCPGIPTVGFKQVHGEEALNPKSLMKRARFRFKSFRVWGWGFLIE